MNRVPDDRPSEEGWFDDPPPPKTLPLAVGWCLFLGIVLATAVTIHLWWNGGWRWYCAALLWFPVYMSVPIAWGNISGVIDHFTVNRWADNTASVRAEIIAVLARLPPGFKIERHPEGVYLFDPAGDTVRAYGPRGLDLIPKLPAIAARRNAEVDFSPFLRTGNVATEQPRDAGADDRA